METQTFPYNPPQFLPSLLLGELEDLIKAPPIHEAHLSLLVRLDLPPPGQLQSSVCKHVDEIHQVTVMLVAFKIACISTDFQNHVL